MNIFSGIWKKHFKRGADPTKLADDMGPLVGKISVTRYDPITGQKFETTNQKNMLVNQSKSTLIRLISQGQSLWLGTIVPADYAITRMRFGNNRSNPAPSRLYYYDINELSSRRSTPVAQIGSKQFAGGLSTQATIEPVGTISKQVTTHTTGVGGTYKYEIPYCMDANVVSGRANPPSHGTLVVNIYNGALLIETLYFGSETLDSDYVYTRSSNGIAPTKITTYGSYDAVTMPAARTSDGLGNMINTNITLVNTNTRLIYDYTTGSSGWKLLLDLVTPASPTFTHILVVYEMGKYNVINSIVPVTGYNADIVTQNNNVWANMMAAAPNRFQLNNDYYTIMGSPEYRDCGEDFIDDFSVTFGVNMTGQYGNGNTDATNNEFIKYKEAFLFNRKDEMFSAVYLDNSFDKNSDSAYYISWTILAPVN